MAGPICKRSTTFSTFPTSDLRSCWSSWTTLPTPLPSLLPLPSGPSPMVRLVQQPWQWQQSLLAVPACHFPTPVQVRVGATRLRLPKTVVGPERKDCSATTLLRLTVSVFTTLILEPKPRSASTAATGLQKTRDCHFLPAATCTLQPLNTCPQPYT